MADYDAIIVPAPGDIALKFAARSGRGAAIIFAFADPKNIVPPVISAFTPAAASSIGRTQSIATSITDVTPGFGRIVLLATVGGVSEVVHDGDNFKAPYVTSSTKVGITNGHTFTVVRDNGWPSASLSLRVVAIDGDGNEASPLDYSWTVTDPDATGPTIDNFNPAKGAAIASAGAATFDVYDSGGDTPELTGEPVVNAVLPDGAVEPVYDGSSFQAPYASSSRSGTNNRSFSIVRTGGWVFPSATLEVTAKDPTGNEVADLYSMPVTNPAPVIANFTPAAASTIAKTDPVVFDVTDDSGLFRRVTVLASYASGLVEVVHDGDNFKGEYVVGSTKGAIAGGFQFSVQRDAGHFAGLTLHVVAIDQDGAEATASAAYTIIAPTASADTTAPVIANLAPAPGATIAATQPISFDVTDNSGAFRRIVVSAFFPRTGIEEVVHDGDGFRGLFQTSSSRAAITDGFAFSVLRTGGWPSSPVIKVFAIDAQGNEGT